MKAVPSILLSLLALVLSAGGAPAQTKRELPAGVKEVLHKAGQFELYSLEPEPAREAEAGKAEKLHGWLVLGKTTVKDAKTRKELLAIVEAGRGKAAKCFEPRHAIRATHGGKTVDLVICFACGHNYVYEGDKHTATLRVGRDDQRAFDKVLKAAKVPLAKQGKKD